MERNAKWKQAELELAIKREKFELETENNATKARLEAPSDDGDEFETRSLGDSSRLPPVDNRTETYVHEQLAHANQQVTSTPGRELRHVAFNDAGMPAIQQVQTNDVSPTRSPSLRATYNARGEQ